MNEIVAIQGFQASFHETAAMHFFGGEVETLECATFPQLFSAMKDGEARFAVCAFENSLAGSILPNYALLRNSELEIFGEVYLCIEMNLMALPGQIVRQIKEIHSHPMAFLQCQEFLDNHPHIQLVESSDTALSAREISEFRIENRAAIAGRRAAEVFGLDIIAADIHDNKRNFTRFLVLRRRGENRDVPGFNKSSISFRTTHLPGSLAKILTVIAACEINLNKIQSLPVIGEEWHYYFYVDLRFENREDYRKMLGKIEPLTTDLKILGEYRQGEKPV
jgi:prephenate dehydratase